MISSFILKEVDSGKSVYYALHEAYDEFLDDYDTDAVPQRSYDDIENEYSDLFENYESKVMAFDHINTIERFLDYNGDLTPETKLEYDKQSSDDKNDYWTFMVIDDQLDADRENLIDFIDHSGYDFDKPISKPVLFISLIVDKGFDITPYKKQVDSLKSSELKDFVKKIQADPGVDIVFSTDTVV